MIRAFTLRSLLARWPRALVSAVTVAMGVAVVTGALVLIDTTHSAYQALFSDAAGGAQLVVSPRQVAGTSVAPGITGAQTSAPGAVSVKLLHAIQAEPGVQAAAGRIVEAATIIGRDGRSVSAGHLQTVAISYLPAPFTGIRLISGLAPARAGEVAVDAATARQQHWQVGDSVTVVTAQPARRFLITGIAQLGSANGAQQRFAVFSPGTARQLYGTGPNYDEIEVAAVRGANLRELTTLIAGMLPSGLVVHTSARQITTAVERVSNSFSTLNGGLIAFAVVSVLVGALVIFNSFSASAAQRRREFAVLRSLGASRLQVVISGLTESLTIGLLGALIGAALGPLVALVIRSLMNSAGVGLPGGGLSVHPRAVGIGAGVGVLVATLAALLPAVSAGRTAPVEALRASQGAGDLNPRRPLLGVALRAVLAAGLGAGGVIVILSASGDENRRLLSSGIGGAMILAAVLVAGPLVVSGIGAGIGVISGPRGRWRFWRRGRGATPPRFGPIFELAREQTVLSPGRTALSASSLMIGVALVMLISVYVTGLRASTRSAIQQTVVGNIAVESANASDPIPAATVQAVSAVPDLGVVSSLKTVTAQVTGAGSVQVAGIDPTSWSHVYRFSWLAGSAQTLAALSPGQALVEYDTAQAAHLTAGSTFTLVGPTGTRIHLTVAGVYRDSGLLSGVVLPVSAFDLDFDQPQLQSIFIQLTGAVSKPVALAALRRGLQRFPGVVVRDQRQLAAKLSTQVSGVVDLLYALLALAVAMSLLGIGGSLNLAIQVRSSELGTLRALGMTPNQVRAMIRYESLLTAAIGGLCGVALGLVIALCGVHALSPEGFAFRFPWAAVGGAVLAVILAGAVAAVAPSRRASRIPILEAITHE